jgi:hypothetical protein
MDGDFLFSSKNLAYSKHAYLESDGRKFRVLREFRVSISRQRESSLN